MISFVTGSNIFAEQSKQTQNPPLHKRAASHTAVVALAIVTFVTGGWNLFHPTAATPFCVCVLYKI